MAANDRQLHVLIQAGRPYQSIQGRWVAFALDPARGVVTESPVSTYRFYDPLWVVAATPNRFVYVGTAYPSYEWTWTCEDWWCTFAFGFATEGDGRLRQVGSAGVPTLDGESNPAIQAGNFLLVPDDGGGVTSFALDSRTGGLVRGPRLEGAFEKFESAHLAYANGRVGLATPTTLSVFDLGSDGTLNLRGQRAVPTEPQPGVAPPSGFVAFDPSGRYLYLSRPGQGVRAFYVGADGQPTDGAAAVQGGGPIVIVPPSP
jgi:hypothetical protein